MSPNTAHCRQNFPFSFSKSVYLQISLDPHLISDSVFFPIQWQPITLRGETPPSKDDHICHKVPQSTLKNNNNNNNYHEYLITIHTGLTRSSATTSKVFLRLFAAKDQELKSLDVSLNVREAEMDREVRN